MTESDEPERERGFYVYECVTCGRRMTSSTVYAGATYDYDHCGKPCRQVLWVSEKVETNKTL